MFESFDDYINEAGMNDPVLMAFRAAKMKREKELAKPKRKPLYGKQREKAEEALWVISQDLKDLYADRGQLLIDMEQEAEIEGGPVADRYGKQLDMIEDKIKSLITQRTKLEMKLAESVVTESFQLKKGDTVKFKDGRSIHILGPKGDGYDYRDGREKGHHPKGWFDMMISSGKAMVESAVIDEAYDGNTADFKYEFPNTFEDVTGNPVKAIKKMAKKGKGFEVRTSIYMSRPEMEEVGKAMNLEVVDYKKGSNVAITVYESLVTEALSTAQKKRLGEYLDNLEFDDLWEISDFVGKQETEVGLEDLPEWKKIQNTKSIKKLRQFAFDYMLKNNLTVKDLKEAGILESIVVEEILCEATVEMDAMDPDNKDFLKFLAKNRVNIISKEMSGPNAQTPVITMQGKRKDLEKVLADPKLGWDDPDLAEYIEESVVNEARSIAKIQKEWGNVTAIMKDKVDAYKKAKGQEKEDLLDELKTLTITKKKLEAELDAAVGLKNIDAELVEGKVTLKRKYTENYPAITAGKQARIRNKMLEAIADGKLTQEEFNTILKEMSIDSSRWVRRNSKYFNVSEDGISLSKFGRKALNQITINENMDNFMFESFEQFNASKNEDASNETLNERYVKSAGYNAAVERIEDLARQLDPNSRLCKGISKGADNVVPEFKEMKKHMDEIYTIWQEIEYTIEMSNESVVNEKLSKSELNKIEDFLYDQDADTLRDICDDLLVDDEDYAEDKYDLDSDDLVGMAMDYIDGESIKLKDVKSMVESVDINEAFKSSKLRNLLNMNQSGSDRYGRKASKLAQGLYGISKIKLDEIEDADLIDLTPKAAYKEASKSNDFIVFYIVDNEKENPYADRNSYETSMLRPGILAVTRGKDFLGVTYDNSASRPAYDKRGGKTNYKMVPDKDGVGGNKNYRGYDASGIYNVKRAADLADRAIVFDMTLADKSSRELVQQRADAQSGAIAFKSDKDFKKANMTRYKDILAQKASKLPLDKIVEDTINTLTKHIADGIKKGETTKFGDLKLGEDKRGRDIKITDAANMMSSILSDYQRYVSAVTNAEREKEEGYSSGYYERSSKEYAKNISDRVKKVKNMDYAW